MSIERNELATLIRAATRWIDASRPARQEKNFSQRLRDLPQRLRNFPQLLMTLPQRLKDLLSGIRGKYGATRA
jgi:uncharacterized protein HemY